MASGVDSGIKKTRTFAYLNTCLWNQQQRNQPTPTIYLLEPAGIIYKLKQVLSIINTMGMAYELREIECGHLGCYCALTAGYTIAYREGILRDPNSLRDHMSQEHAELVQSGAIVVRSIAVPNPLPPPDLNALTAEDYVEDAATCEAYRANAPPGA
jgi:hypothetical protein